MASKDKVWYAVVNPHAGSGKTVSEWPKAEQLFQSKGIDYEYKTTWRKYHASEIAFDACKAGYRRFLAVGGDGTVHEVLDGIARFTETFSRDPDDTSSARLSLSDFTLAVVPIGSGNDWIKTLHVPHSTEAVVDLIAREHFEKQDVFRLVIAGADGKDDIVSYMVNIGGIGFDANVCHRVNFEKDSGKSGKILYVKVLVQNIVKRHAFPCRVFADGALAYEGDTLSIAMGIGRYSGGGMLQVPDALNDDKLLDFTVIPDLPLGKIVKAVPGLFNGRLVADNPELYSYRSSSLRIEIGGDASELVEVDGEVIGEVSQSSPLCVELLPEQLNVVAG